MQSVPHRHMGERREAPPVSLAEAALTHSDVEAILDNMFMDQEEHQFASFCATYAKYRPVVCQWMLDIGDYFNLHETTSHAAIAYLDRLQPNEKFSRNQWQMLGICCIIMAAKYNENEEHVPELAALQGITQQHIPREELLKYEMWALQRMGWILCARTVPSFLSCYINLGVIFDVDTVILHGGTREGTDEDIARLEQIIRKQSSALATMSTLDVRFKGFPCSLVAASVLLVSRRSLGISMQDVWPMRLVELTKYSIDDLYVVVQLIDCASEEISRWMIANNSRAGLPQQPASDHINIETAENMRTPEKDKRASREEKISISPINSDVVKQTASFRPSVPEIIVSEVVLSKEQILEDKSSPASIADPVMMSIQPLKTSLQAKSEGLLYYASESQIGGLENIDR